MPSLPDPLHDKLGDSAADGLVEYVRHSLDEHTNHVFELVEDRFARRVLESEDRLRQEMNAGLRQLEEKSEGKFQRLEEKFDRKFERLVNKFDGKFEHLENKFDGKFEYLENKFDRKFERIYERFADIHHQITVQTRWIVASGGFIAVAFKLVDLFVK